MQAHISGAAFTVMFKTMFFYNSPAIACFCIDSYVGVCHTCDMSQVMWLYKQYIVYMASRLHSVLELSSSLGYLWVPVQRRGLVWLPVVRSLYTSFFFLFGISSVSQTIGQPPPAGETLL